MTQEDSVRRLAEIRERVDEGIPEEAPVIDTYFEDVPYLLSVIDSLTARAEAAEADRERLREALERLSIQAERHMKGPDGYYSIAAKARAALATPLSEGQSL